MERGAWCAAVHGVAHGRARRSLVTKHQQQENSNQARKVSKDPKGYLAKVNKWFEIPHVSEAYDLTQTFSTPHAL